MSAQSAQALQRGDALRCSRAQWRREVTAAGYRRSRVLLAESLEGRVVAEPPAGLKLRAFLTAAHRIGHRRAAGIADRAGFRRSLDTTRVRDLTLRERSALAAELRRSEMP